MHSLASSYRHGCGSSLHAGHIKAYGLSAWTAFHLPASHPQSLSLEDLVDLAQQAGGFESNGFRYIQVITTSAAMEKTRTHDGALGFAGFFQGSLIA